MGTWKYLLMAAGVLGGCLCCGGLGIAEENAAQVAGAGGQQAGAKKSTAVRPILLLQSPDAAHPLDAYLEEVLLGEGYNGYLKRPPAEAGDLAAFALVLVSSGAAAQMAPETILDYVQQGGRAVILQPPRAWAPRFGLEPAGRSYSIARDAYLQVDLKHRWMDGFPAADLQVPDESHVYGAGTTEPLALVAGARGRPSIYPAVALTRHGAGSAVVFTYDLAEAIVRLHQGWPATSSTGNDPDANRDGKFTADDLFHRVRDFDLRDVPQADVHQDLLVRVIRGLLDDAAPLPRLWHFPRAAPALVFIDGDSDGMIWEDLEWVVREAAATRTKYTLYLMTEHIKAFDREKIAALRQQGHEFGVHPWVSAQPDLATWRQCVAEIVGLFREKFGYEPRALRAHSCIFPGWDENPRLLAEHGLRLDTDFINGYRFGSGYLNGSALPVKFISREGELLDCYSQSTVQTEDGSCSPKFLLPPMNEDEALAVARQLLADCAGRWHGVFHPYFHPVSLSGRGKVPCQNWFRQILLAARDLDLPSVNAGEWLDFNDARRAAAVDTLAWDGETLVLSLQAPSAMAGLTLLLPPRRDGRPLAATLAGAPCEVVDLALEGMRWQGMVVDLPAQSKVELRVSPAGPKAADRR
ncbi:MAG: hypothetical protein HUU20_04740 [Pirellulales bacterium]|nr:hypothetical protein [Pirellulales bacterium]